jgi:Ala-tRNA(Pro) deacylase
MKKRKMTKEKAYEFLNKLGITYSRLEHEALFGCSDLDGKAGLNPKNLLIHNANKSKFYLALLNPTKRVDMKELQAILNDTRLSFASCKDLDKRLKITRGAVGLLNLVSVENPQVEVIVDKCILETERVGVHPNVNTETVTFDGKEILKILDHLRVAWRVVEL